MSHRLPLLVCGAAALLVGCDVDPASALDYDAIAHVELDAVESSSWAKGALKDGTFRLSKHDKDTDACGKLLKQATALTFGAGHKRAEFYLTGKLDEGDTDACFDQLEAAAEKGDEVRFARIHGSLTAVAIGQSPVPAPTQARLDDLLDADPSPKGDQPIWFTVNRGPKADDVKYMEGWADPRKGLDAHVHVEFKDEATATKLHAEASLALTAARLSDELGGVAKAVKLAAAGDTMTADIHAPKKLMDKFVATAKAKKPKGDKDDKKSGFSISIGTK